MIYEKFRNFRSSSPNLNDLHHPCILKLCWFWFTCFPLYSNQHSFEKPQHKFFCGHSQVMISGLQCLTGSKDFLWIWFGVRKPRNDIGINTLHKQCGVYLHSYMYIWLNYFSCIYQINTKKAKCRPKSWFPICYSLAKFRRFHIFSIQAHLQIVVSPKLLTWLTYFILILQSNFTIWALSADCDGPSNTHEATSSALPPSFFILKLVAWQNLQTLPPLLQPPRFLSFICFQPKCYTYSHFSP